MANYLDMPWPELDARVRQIGGEVARRGRAHPQHALYTAVTMRPITPGDAATAARMVGEKVVRREFGRGARLLPRFGGPWRHVFNPAVGHEVAVRSPVGFTLLIGTTRGYRRDKTLLHELAHVVYWDSHWERVDPEDDAHALIEWAARRARSNPTVLKTAVEGLGFKPHVYDAASHAAFRREASPDQLVLPFGDDFEADAKRRLGRLRSMVARTRMD